MTGLGGYEPAWCEQHERWECGRPTDNGPCHTSGAGPCKRHPVEQAVALPDEGGHRLVSVTAWSVDVTGPVTPRESMILMLQVSWFRWQQYARMIEASIKERPDGSALVGEVVSDFKMGPNAGTTYATGEKVRALVELEANERDRCARLATQAHDMGITEGEWKV